MRSRTPKVLHELCGRPMVLWPVRAALEAGAGRVVVVDSPERALERVLPEGVELAVQERPDGTGGATVAAMAKLDGGAGSELDPAAPIVILSGDVPLLSAEAITGLIEVHTQSGAAATMASTILDDPTGYGRVVRDSAGAVERVVETKEHGDSTQSEREIREVNTGIFVFAAHALRHALPRLSADNAQGELYLPQVLEELRADGAAVAAYVVQDQRLVLGVNDRVALARVRRLAQAAIHERHMRAGVGIVDPDATVIDVDVEIGQDTLIEPFTTIRGATRIGENAPCATPISWIACSRTGSAWDRSATCARAPCCARAPGWAPSWRSRTPTSAPAPGSPTSPTSATRTSARTPTSAPPPSPPTTTVMPSIGRPSGGACAPAWTRRSSLP